MKQFTEEVTRLLAAILLVLAGCAAEPSQLQRLGDEGLSITKRVNFSSPPEAKLQAAQDLLTHASIYDQLINRSTDARFIAKAHRVQHQEREAAATLMREAAADYVKRNDMAKARDISTSPSSPAFRRRNFCLSVEPPSPLSIN